MPFQTHFACLVTVTLGFSVTVAEGAALGGGHISQVNHDVRFRNAQTGWTAARLNAAFNDGSIQTGAESRAEIAFSEQTVVRLGDKTRLDIESGNRVIELISGAILTQVPSGVGGTTVQVRNITATATGATMAIESLPKAYTKFIVLDGTSRLCLKKDTWASDCVLLRAGQMLIAGPNAKALPDAVDVDLRRLVETCQFITEFPKLPGQERVTRAAAAQARDKSQGGFADTNLVIHGRGTLVNVTKSNGAGANPGTTSPAKPTASPKLSPTPPR
jgi:hypothetical protein